MVAGNLGECDTGLFYYCIYFHSIQWAVFKIKGPRAAYNTLNPIIYPAPIRVKRLPLAVPRTNTVYKSFVFRNKLFDGTVIQTIQSALWNSLNDDLISMGTPSFEIVGGQSSKLVQGRTEVEVSIKFITSKRINPEGSIEIRFGANIPKVYPHCHSLVAATVSTSKLYSSAADNIGEISCKVQSSRSWVITGFKELAAAATVNIYGLIDMPNSGATTTGAV